MYSDFQKKMDAYLDRYCELYSYSGILRVTLKDEVIYERCMGEANIDTGEMIKPDSRFNFYSLSKPFCAIGLLKLVDRGLVDLSAHPSKYTPWAEGFDARVTIDSMLRHTSGMPDYSQLPEGTKNVDSRDALRESVDMLKTLPMNFAPYEGVLYSNINFTLSASIIEQVSGMAYADYMQKEVFEPLGMKSAVVNRVGLKIPDHVSGHDINGEKTVTVTRYGVSWMLGAGDIVGTVDDVYCLNRAIKHRLLLKPETWEKVLTPLENSTFGYGCAVSLWHGKERIQHNGGSTGFRTLHIQLPEDDFDLILLSNRGYGNSRGTISEAAWRAFYGDMKDGASVAAAMDKGYIQDVTSGAVLDGFLPKLPAAVEMSAEEEAYYLGDYGGQVLSKRDDRYVFTDRNGRKLICLYVGDGLFCNTVIDEGYRITKDAEGYPCFWGKRKA